MSPLTEYLDQILAWHSRHGTPAAASLQPGLSEAEILARTSQLPFKLTGEFLELYRWRNGVPWDTSGDPSFFEFHRFLPLDEAMVAFRESHPIFKRFYPITDWVMTFQDPAGDGYGLSGGKGHVEAAPVTFLMEGEGVQIVFENLTQMMKSVIACFDEGVFWWGDNQLQTDFYRLGDVMFRLNPNMQYWKDYARGDRT